MRLSDEVVNMCFAGTDSRIQGADFAGLESGSVELAARAWNPREPMDQGGLLKYVHGGEYHMYNPDVVATLQAAVTSGDYEQYKVFAQLVNPRPASTLRDLLGLMSAAPIPLHEVESAQ